MAFAKYNFSDTSNVETYQVLNNGDEKKPLTYSAFKELYMERAKSIDEKKYSEVLNKIWNQLVKYKWYSPKNLILEYDGCTLSPVYLSDPRRLFLEYNEESVIDILFEALRYKHDEYGKLDLWFSEYNLESIQKNMKLPFPADENGNYHIAGNVFDCGDTIYVEDVDRGDGYITLEKMRRSGILIREITSCDIPKKLAYEYNYAFV